MKSRIVSSLVVATCSLAWCIAAPASSGRTPGGVAYSIGGIGADEEMRMAADSANHALSVRFAARGSGAYLPDVELRITDNRQQAVFSGRLDGPWLLIDLPAGRYELVGEYAGEVTRLEVAVPTHGHRSAVMYFVVEGASRPFRGDRP